MASKETTALLIDSNKGNKENKQCMTRQRWIILLVVLGVLILAAIIIIVVVVTTGEDDEEQITPESNEFYENKFLEIPSNESCYQYSQQFASKPHVAGMGPTLEIGTEFYDIMQELGYEPIRDNIPNAVLDHYNMSQLFINGEEIDLSQEPIPDQPETDTPFRERSWIAYSASGNHTAPLLYVNNGEPKDYDFLVNTIGIDLNNSGIGYIGLAKRGSRVDQANWAGSRGLKGLILFENNYREDESVRYPNGPQMPNFGFRVDGRIRYTGCTGNPDVNRMERECGLDPQGWDDLFPAIKYNLAMIQLSPNTAIELFEIMNRSYTESRCDAILNNANWSLELPIAACIGGTNEIMANLITKNEMHTDDVIQNVYGYLEGEQYPDEIVMVGAHRDAWAMGACDDVSGTVTILEIARSLSVLRSQFGWRPKRSIMFGSWDGEEWGLYGSTDFCESNNTWIQNVVAYFNFDMTVIGGSLNIQGNPMLRELLLETAKQVKYPYPDADENNAGNDSLNFTLYDTWWNFSFPDKNNLPLTGCSSDFCAFEYYSGIATLGAGFGKIGDAYTYHSFYDLNGWLDIVDPKWEFAKAIASYGGLMMLKFAQQDLIPFDVKRLALKMSEWTEIDLPGKVEAKNDTNCTLWFDAEIGLLDNATDSFQDATDKFDNYYQRILDITNNDEDSQDVENDIKIINDILRIIMPTLTLKYPDGVPSGKWWKQLIWGNGKRFPYIWDIIDGDCDADDLSEAFSITINAIEVAADLLDSVENE